MVGALLFLSRQPWLGPLFRYMPLPLWCYLLPALGVHVGWLPREAAQASFYRPLIQGLLPIALVLLLLGADLPAILRTGTQALLAAVTGAAGVLLGAVLGVWMMQGMLPAQAWKGAGALVGTWTGGTMNLLALRALLETPESVFAPLILVDALVAYSWMALLVAASGSQSALNRWLRATEMEILSTPLTRRVLLPRASSMASARGMRDVQQASPPSPTAFGLSAVPTAQAGMGRPGPRHPPLRMLRDLLLCLTVALVVFWSARWIAGRLPTTLWINSAAGWTVWLATTMALALALLPSLRNFGAHGPLLGYPCLYVVLAATGAQASLRAFFTTPAWVAVGFVVIVIHAGLLLWIGRWRRVPMGILATASQANIGGVVSAPMVGAVYHPSLAPLGAVLAIAGNALGTYLGVAAAHLCRWLTRSS